MDDPDSLVMADETFIDVFLKGKLCFIDMLADDVELKRDAGTVGYIVDSEG